MLLILSGHDYKYAVEQIMLAMFPGERPRYTDASGVRPDSHSAGSAISSPADLTAGPAISSPAGPVMLIAESRLTFGMAYAQATTTLRGSAAPSDAGTRPGTPGPLPSRGTARVKLDKLTGAIVRDRLLQRAIKQSFYRAAVKYAGSAPVWGSLTGIRPAKLAASALERGASVESAARMMRREYYVDPERAMMCARAARFALDVRRGLSPRDVALYVGIPFCPSRCAYCSFVSGSVEKSFGLIAPFVKTLRSEIRQMGAVAAALGLRAITVYVGGGTPTSLPPESLREIMEELNISFDLSGVLEYTVEAGRPDTLTQEKIDVMARMGAGRICVNPQSMSPRVLAAIGRGHTPEETLAAAEMAKSSAMALNMDIIAGLPGDDPDGFAKTLESVLGCKPENITVHTLSRKRGSRILLENAALPSDGAVAAMLGYASRELRAGGYGPYYIYRQKFTSGGFENTGWSLPGHEGLYNVCMMEELTTVLGMGGGGVTKLVLPGGRIERIFNAKYPAEYIALSEKFPQKTTKLLELHEQNGPTRSVATIE